jgi:hypothetical protein
MIVTMNQLQGALAMWVCRQSPYRSVGGVDAVTSALAVYALNEPSSSGGDATWFGPHECRMREFACEGDLRRWLVAAISMHPQMTVWNTPRNNSNRSFVFASAHHAPSPDNDFIDISALLRNVARTAWLECEDERGWNSRKSGTVMAQPLPVAATPPTAAGAPQNLPLTDEAVFRAIGFGA